MASTILQTVIGHGEVIKALQSSIASEKIGHAYLLLGPAGVGKKTLIKAFARELLCERGTNPETCDCDACRLFKIGSHPDFKTIEPQGNSIKIEQLREVQHQAYLSSVRGKRKIYFFPDAEKLTDVAANSFLKLLEEAPPGIIFLFTAVRADHILPTIRSRCQVYQLFPVAIPEIEARLIDLGYDHTEALRRSKLSQGLPGLALQEGAGGIDDNGWRMGDLVRNDLVQLFKIAEELEKKERKELILLMQQWEVELRNELIALGNEDSVKRSAQAIRRLAESIMMCDYNVNTRLVLDDFFIYLKRLYG